MKNDAVPRSARGGAEDRRLPLRGVPRALRARSARPSTPTACATSSCRRSSGASTTTRGRSGSSSGRGAMPQSSISGGRPLRLPRRGDRRRRRRRASVSAPAWSDSTWRSADASAGAPSIDVFFAFEDAAPPRPRFSPRMARAARETAARATPTTPGRSLKGQLTQAQRLGRRDRGDRTQRGHGAAPPAAGATPSRCRRRWSELAGMTLAGPHVRRGPARARRAAAHARPAGPTRAATTAGLVFVDLRDKKRDLPARRQPGARARRPRRRPHDVRNEFVLRAEGEVVRRAPEDVNPNIPTGEVEFQVDALEILVALDAAPVPARRGGRRRDAAAPLPLARPPPAEDAAQHRACARSSSRRSGV